MVVELKVLMGKEEKDEYRLLKKVEQWKLCDETKKANAAKRHLVTDDKTQSNKLTKEVTLWVVKQVRLTKVKNGDRREPWRKRQIEGDIKNLRKRYHSTFKREKKSSRMKREEEY